MYYLQAKYKIGRIWIWLFLHRHTSMCNRVEFNVDRFGNCVE